MRRITLWVMAAMLLAVPAHALEPAAGDVVVADYAFPNGQILPGLKLHYLTLGTPRRDAAGAVTNAVLLLHGTTGTAQAFPQPRFQLALYGPGAPLDTSRFYLVMPNGIGVGGSSKPSDGLRAHFPTYGYLDQVRTQHAMLQKLGIAHLKLVLGTSMGGMQTWLWAETYPTDADGFVAIASTPGAGHGPQSGLAPDDRAGDPRRSRLERRRFCEGPSAARLDLQIGAMV